jgi:hypothetical protein
LLQRLLVTAALPLGMMAAAATPAHAGSVTVTGANGANGSTPGQSGGAGGSATATMTTSNVPSNSATATGGNGGWAFSYPIGSCLVFTSRCLYNDANGGAGGPSTATATTTISTGATSALATATGGTGGAGGFGLYRSGHGGAGGDATSAATASTGYGSASATATATGGTGGAGRLHALPGFGGNAAATASASSGGTWQIQAAASAFGGPIGAGLPGAASGFAHASAEARNKNGDVKTTGIAPHSGSASALTKATILPPTGSGSVSASIAQGQVVSYAIRTPQGPDFGIGAMAAAYGGPGETSPLDYTATALFDFSASSEKLYLNLLSGSFSNVSGIAFDRLELQVSVNGVLHTPYIFSSLTGAEHFFTNDPLLAIAAGSRSVSLTYDLTYKSGTLAKVGDGFGFTYDLASSAVAATPIARAFDFPVSQSSTIPEPSTWAMMLLGFAGLGYAGMRRSYGLARGRIGLAA